MNISKMNRDGSLVMVMLKGESNLNLWVINMKLRKKSLDIHFKKKRKDKH